MKIEIQSLDEDDCECSETHELPSKFEVCGECRGKGTIVNPSIDRYHGITQEEFDNDPQFFEDYTSGVYNEQCPRCAGLRVIEVVDKSMLNPEQKKIFSKYREQEEDRAAFDREWAREIRMQECMGGGW